MPIRVVRLGSPRAQGEGLRIGTVRRPPRGVPREEFATRDFYDTWLPQLSPSPELVKVALAAQHAEDATGWTRFERAFRQEMATPDSRHLIDLLVAISQHQPIAVGCYCEDERWCHRAVLRDLLDAAGAEILP